MGERATPCERIHAHLGALADGELQPFEVIALHRHLACCAHCRNELERIESLKLQVHVAARQHEATEDMDARWRRAIAGELVGRRPSARRPWLGWAAVALAAVALALGTPYAAGWRPALLGHLLQARSRLDHDALARMVRIHRGVATPEALETLVRSGALVTFENLPPDFIAPDNGHPALIQASFADCDETRVGTSLAVLRGDRIILPATLRAAVAMTGVYVQLIDGVEVRVSVSGGKVFILLSDTGAPGALPAI